MRGWIERKLHQGIGRVLDTGAFHDFFFARPGTPAVVFSLYDSDSPSGDDAMGSITLTSLADYSSGIDLGDAKIKCGFMRF